VFCTRLLATKKNQPRVPVVQASTVLNEFNTSLLQVTFNIAVQWFSTVEYLFQHDHCRWSNRRYYPVILIILIKNYFLKHNNNENKREGNR
jgi:hypothetical protein